MKKQSHKMINPCLFCRNRIADGIDNILQRTVKNIRILCRISKHPKYTVTKKLRNVWKFKRICRHQNKSMVIKMHQAESENLRIEKYANKKYNLIRMCENFFKPVIGLSFRFDFSHGNILTLNYCSQIQHKRNE